MAVLAALKLVVADEDPEQGEMVAAGLRLQGFDVSPLARTGEEALSAVCLHRPRVAILNLSLPRLDGIGVTRLAARRAPETRVILYADAATQSVFVQALTAGACGFLDREKIEDDLFRAVEVVADGGLYVNTHPVTGSEAQHRAELSERESEVLALLADGRSSLEIAAKLPISPETLRTYVRRSMGKLGAQNRIQAVATALRLALIDNR
jgi:DNA-binding NarL/FixJ family response regulator